MALAENSFINSALSGLAQKAGKPVLNAIQTASRQTGVDFSYLLQQAAAESSFNPEAKAKTSSATGLFQFLDSTWLDMVKKHGDKHGLSNFAAQIDNNGKIADPAVKQEILELRKDPKTASLLAAEFAADNKSTLLNKLAISEEEIGAVELYLAHFMGAGGASTFLNQMQNNPLAQASDIFPQAAKANKNVFFDKDTGQPRTLAGIYDFFAQKFDAKPTNKTPPSPLRIDQPYDHNVADSVNNLSQIIAMQQNSMRDMVSTALHSNDNENNRHGFVPMSDIPLRNPVELMILAQLKTPLEHDLNEQ